MKKVSLIVLLILTLLLTIGCQSKNTNTDKKALLVVSFGSSFIENRQASIDASEAFIANAFADYDKYSAFTSQIIIDVYKDRDNIDYLNVEQAIEEIYKGKYGQVLVVPTHVINGEEYDQMIEAIRPFEDKFETLTISSPLLTHSSDYDKVADAVLNELPDFDDKTAVVLMGHGTPHPANSAYSMLDYVFKHKGYENVYIGTVEGTPEFEDVVNDLEGKGYEKVLLMPLMVVAGDHAHNDMAGDDEDSWKIMFKSLGYDVETILHGMGELDSIQELFVEHAKEALQDEDL